MIYLLYITNDMKKIIRLTESELTRIVKRVIKESDEPVDVRSCLEGVKNIPEACTSKSKYSSGGVPNPQLCLNSAITILQDEEVVYCIKRKIAGLPPKPYKKETPSVQKPCYKCDIRSCLKDLKDIPEACKSDSKSSLTKGLPNPHICLNYLIIDPKYRDTNIINCIKRKIAEGGK